MKRTDMLRPPLLLTRMLCVVALLAACSSQPETGDTSAIDARFLAFLAAEHQRQLARSPMTAQQYGDRSVAAVWDDFSLEFAAESARQRKQVKAALSAFARQKLNRQNRLSYDLMEMALDRQIAVDTFPPLSFPVNTRDGFHIKVINQLIDWHRIEDIADARAYIQRLKVLPTTADQVVGALNEAKDAGIIAPRFTLQRSALQMEALLQRYPLTSYPPGIHPLLEDFTAKLDGLGLSGHERENLNEAAQIALSNQFRRAFSKVRDQVIRHSSQAEELGIWNLPEGRAYYRSRLAQFTDSDATPDRMHQIANDQITLLHREMEQVIARTGADLSREQFALRTRHNKNFYYVSGTQDGNRAAGRANAVLDEILPALNRLFTVIPQSGLALRVVESADENDDGSGYKAVYSPPQLEGVMLLNLAQSEEIPAWQIMAATFGAAYPGTHMQTAMAFENPALPAFRRHYNAPAYLGGWRLYAEYLPWEIGFYRDPMDDYGRLVRDLIATVQLGADTGVHHKGWSFDRAVEYMIDNAPISREHADRLVRRIFVKPGAAAAAKMGFLKFLDLRSVAESALGERFDIRAFHQLILSNGPVPMTILDREVQRWIAAQQQI